ncbi:hypothetical protein SRB521_01876 [Intestinimonas butyriciproducens]|nr:hypothetical protein SRB521_01876 [Intestinimonas butyriciproducens]
MGPEAENPAKPERPAAATRHPAVPAGRPLPAALLRKGMRRVKAARSKVPDPMKERVIRTMRRGIPILMICALLLGSAAKAADMNSAAKGMSVPAGTLAAYDSTDYEKGEVLVL